MNPSEGEAERENNWRKMEGRNPLPAPDPVRTALSDRLLTLSDVEQSFGRSYNAQIMREAEAALRAAPQPLSNPLGLPKRPDSIYSQFHLDNWTDDDFAKHTAATRKTLTWLLELEAAILTLPAEGGAREATIEECAAIIDLFAAKASFHSDKLLSQRIAKQVRTLAIPRPNRGGEA